MWKILVPLRAPRGAFVSQWHGRKGVMGAAPAGVAARTQAALSGGQII
jgi:hypothetical protein